MTVLLFSPALRIRGVVGLWIMAGRRRSTRPSSRLGRQHEVQAVWKRHYPQDPLRAGGGEDQVVRLVFPLPVLRLALHARRGEAYAEVTEVSDHGAARGSRSESTLPKTYGRDPRGGTRRPHADQPQQTPPVPRRPASRSR